MLSRNKIDSKQREKTGFCARFISVLTSLMLIGFCVNLASGADSIKTAYKYQEIKALAKKLEKNQSESEDLETLVAKSKTFIETHPTYKRVDEVYYALGNALVELERVEEGIKVFEQLITAHPAARKVESGLLGLGLAYDKLGKHDKADAAYKKLIEHPKFGSRSQAKIAKKILEQERASRKGESPIQPRASAGPSEWVGKPAPDFEVMDLKGKKLSLKKYRGQVVLLDFWATWCGPCIAEVPNVKATYKKYKDQKFQIIGISLDNSKATLEKYIAKEGLGWHHYLDASGKVSTLYKVSGIPSTFLIDGEGVIRKADLRGHTLETAVAELVKENLAKPAETAGDTPESGSKSKSIPATKLLKPNKTAEKGESAKPAESRPDPTEWVGKPAPDFEVTDLKDKKLALKDYRGQVVLLDFWATWCGPCIAEMPKVKKAYEKYKDQKFQIIGISLDRSQPPLDAYIEKEGITWHNYWDKNREVRNLYKVWGIPTTFLIDGEGVIRKASLGGFDVETAVAELVEENLAKQADSTIDTPVDSPEIAELVVHITAPKPGETNGTMRLKDKVVDFDEMATLLTKAVEESTKTLIIQAERDVRQKQVVKVMDIAKQAGIQGISFATPPETEKIIDAAVDAKAQEIIDAAIAAHGGLEKLQAVKNIVVVSRSLEYHPDDSIDDEGTAKMYIYPDKFRGDWYWNDEVNSVIFDGNSLFRIEDGKVEQVPPNQAKFFIDDYKKTDFREPIWPLTTLLKKDVTVQYVGTEEVKGVPASVLLVTEPSGKERKFFISEKTHYVVKMNYSSEMGEETMDVVKYLGDYRDVDGIKIPHHIATKTFEHRENIVTEITLNAEIDDKLFLPDQEKP